MTFNGLLEERILKKPHLFLVFVFFIIQACSKNDANISTSNISSKSFIDSQFIDAPVKGLSYECEGSCSGETLDEGRFSCIAGEIVHFNVAGLYIGSAVCSEKIFVDDLVGFKSEIDNTTAGIIIQSLAEHNEDENGEVKSLDLSRFKKYASEKKLDLKETDPRKFSENEISDHIKSLSEGEKDPKIIKRDELDARSHLNKSLKKYSYFTKDTEKLLEGVIEKGEPITINGKIRDSSSASCPSYTQFRVKIGKDADSSVYFASVGSNAYFNSLDNYDEKSNSCMNAMDKTKAPYSDLSEYSKVKSIESTDKVTAIESTDKTDKIDCIDSNKEEIAFLVDRPLTSSKLNILHRFAGDTTVTTKVTLNTEVVEEKGFVKGKLSLQAISEDQKILCEYDLTNEKIDFSGDSGAVDGGGETSKELPEVGNWSGKIEKCTDPTALDLVGREISMSIQQIQTKKGSQSSVTKLDFNAPEMGEIKIPLNGGSLVNQDYDKGRININYDSEIGVYQISAYFYDDDATDGINTECKGRLTKILDLK